MMGEGADIFVFIFILTLTISVFIGCAVMMVRLLPKAVEKPLWMKAVFWGIYAVLSVLVPNIWRNDMLTMAVLTAVYLPAGWFLYHRSRMGLLYQLIYMAVMYMAEVIAIFLGVRLELAFGLEYMTRYCLVNMLEMLFQIGVMAVIKEILKRRYISDRKSLKIRGMVLVPLFSIGLIFLYIIGSEVFFARYGYEWLILYCILILVINLYCLYFWYDVAANRELKHKLGMMRQQNELTHQYYGEMERNYNESRKIIHDIRNHISALEQLGKLEQTQEYISDVNDMLNSLSLKFYSENRMLNIVLNDKFRNLSPGQLECNLGGICLDFLSDMDITTIFANLLDNALEEGESAADFWVKLRGEQIQDFTVIRIWNHCNTGYTPGHSGKAGHEGLGLENAKQAIKKYSGELKVEYEDAVFSVTVIFPGQE